MAEVATRLRRGLGEDLLAVYVTGSGALGDWVRGHSDIDLVAVCSESLGAEARRRLAASVSHRRLACPARRLELVVYRREAVRAPRPPIEFQINLNTGPGIDDHLSLDRCEEPGHWFLIDLDITRRHGDPVVGPPPDRVIGRLERADVLAAVAGSVRWYARHESRSADAVLAGCRGWRYAVEGDWAPKGAAGRWALARGADRALLERALARREGGSGELDGAAVRAFLADVDRALEPIAAGRG